MLVRQVLECLRPLDSILRVANALVREVRESNVGRHGASPLLCAAASYLWLPPASLGRHNRAQLCAGHCCGRCFAFTRELTHSTPPLRGEETVQEVPQHGLPAVRRLSLRLF